MCSRYPTSAHRYRPLTNSLGWSTVDKNSPSGNPIPIHSLVSHDQRVYVSDKTLAYGIYDSGLHVASYDLAYTQLSPSAIRIGFI